MGIIAWIVIGLLAGWLANAILGGRGGGLFYQPRRRPGRRHCRRRHFRGLHIVPENNFIGQLVSATVGAIVFLLIWRAIRRA